MKPVTLLCVALAGMFCAVPGMLEAQYPKQPPAAMELRPLQFPPFQEVRLRNGMTLLVVEEHRLPAVSLNLTLLAGGRSDPAGMEGLASMTAALLTKGTETRSADQIAEEIEFVGASLFANAGDDFFSIGTTVLADHVELAFELMSDVVLRSTFPQEELELERTRTLSALQVQKSDPGALASKYFSRAIYGDHPYGRSIGEESVQRITREAVQQFAATHLKPGGGLLVLAGDITLREGRRLAERAFGSWTGSPPEARYPPPPASRSTEIILVHRPGSVQSNIRVGNLALRPGDPVYYAAVVMNRVLGGGSDARLFEILREEKSWTYGAYSAMARLKDVGYFQANTEVRTPVTDSALVEIIHQMNRIRDEAVPADELNGAKGYLVGSFPLSIQTPQQIAGQIANVRLLGLGDDYLRTYHQRLDAVSTDHLTQAARRVISIDSAVIVVVGDGQEVYDKLTPIAPVRIIDAEGNPLTPDALAPSGIAVAFDLAELVASSDSFNALVQGNPFGYGSADHHLPAQSGRNDHDDADARPGHARTAAAGPSGNAAGTVRRAAPHVWSGGRRVRNRQHSHSGR
jgi:predicted Zn-dependent peptidase